MVGWTRVVRIHPASCARTVGELAGNDTETGLEDGGVEIFRVVRDTEYLREQEDAKAVVVPVWAQQTRGGPVRRLARRVEVAVVLRHFIKVEHRCAALSVVELQTSVARIVEGPAIAHDGVQLARLLRVSEEARRDLHRPRVRCAARGGKWIDTAARLLLRPDQKVRRVLRHCETALRAVELGAHSGHVASDDGCRPAKRRGQRGGIDACLPPAHFFQSGKVRCETTLRFVARYQLRLRRHWTELIGHLGFARLFPERLTPLRHGRPHGIEIIFGECLREFQSWHRRFGTVAAGEKAARDEAARDENLGCWFHACNRQ